MSAPALLGRYSEIALFPTGGEDVHEGRDHEEDAGEGRDSARCVSGDRAQLSLITVPAIVDRHEPFRERDQELHSPPA
jgi:hypothetical protein